MNKEKKKMTILLISFACIIIILVLLLGADIIANMSRTNNAVSNEEMNEEDITQNIKNKLESKSYTITEKIKDSIAKNSINNIDFTYGYCSDENSNYEVVYLLKQDDKITGSMLIFYYSKDTYELLKVTYKYQYEFESGTVIDEKSNASILGNLFFAIDEKAFANEDIVSIIKKVHENNYTFASDYKISVSNNYIWQMFIYDFEKIY